MSKRRLLAVQIVTLRQRLPALCVSKASSASFSRSQRLRADIFVMQSTKD